jgi:DNA polymerase III epsilon subunit-like protein
MPHYMIIDCETSHLFDYSQAADAPGQPRLAQLGLIFVDHKYQIEAEHEWLIKPEGWEMSAEATEKTGLTTDYLKEHGMPIHDALQLYLSGILCRRVVAGFNVQFDLKQCRAELRRAGLEDQYLQTRNLCLMWATRPIVAATDARGKVKIPKLEEACAFFGIEQPKAHSALADAKSAYQLMMKLVDRGALPEPKSPFDKKPKKPKGTKRQRRQQDGDDADQDMPEADFLHTVSGEIEE